MNVLLQNTASAYLLRFFETAHRLAQEKAQACMLGLTANRKNDLTRKALGNWHSPIFTKRALGNAGANWCLATFVLVDFE